MPASMRLAGKGALSAPTPVVCQRREGRSTTLPEQRLRDLLTSQCRDASPRARRPSLSSTRSSASSTICSEGDRGGGLQKRGRASPGPAAARRGSLGSAAHSSLPGALPPDCAASLLRCVELIKNECAFLRLRGYWLNVENQLRSRRRGVCAMIRFYVQGLPWAKRAKWLQPLLWSVVGVLQRHGRDATVRGGDLYVALDNGGSVRVDFAASRD